MWILQFNYIRSNQSMINALGTRRFKKDMNEKFARAVKNGEVIHATSLDEETDRGLACNCTCVECGKVVQFVTRRIPFTTKFFRHHESSSCGGGIMTALHRAAQQILVRSDLFQTKQGAVSYENAVMEKQFGDFRADVYGSLTSGNPLVCEIVVNCELTAIKIAYLREQKINSIRFDLETISPKISDQDLEHLIIKDINLKSYIYWDSFDQENLEKRESAGAPVSRDSDNTGFWIVLGLAVLAGWIWGSKKGPVKTKLRKRAKKWLT